jgi:D-proline reductase (dithiol) PrdB
VCNQSVGLIQRAVEAAAISTISISLSKEITRKVNPPRAVYTGLPLGHPLGFPGQRFRQLQVLRHLLQQLEEIDSPGTLIELDLSTAGDDKVHCTLC